MNKLIQISRELSESVDVLRFCNPVAYVYNPLRYAKEPHEMYLEKFGGGDKKTVLLGMNPGPFGMAQTGVPFGDVQMTREFLEISGKVEKPDKEHSKRLIQGFDCPRKEVSGTRVWTFVKERFETPKRFFADFFVVNYCPLVFMESSGKNLTPDKLPKNDRKQLYAICNDALRKTVDALNANNVIGIGAFAEQRAKDALAATNIRTGRILHPSPASPAANRGWAIQAEKQLEALGLIFGISR